MSKKKFPNGFTSWMETHHEVVSYIANRLWTYRMSKLKQGNDAIVETDDTLGTNGLYDLAKKWTDEFELLHEGRKWDDEFWDEVEEFCQRKNSE